MATTRKKTSFITENRNAQDSERYSEELHDIIFKVPSWLLRWGILLFFLILLVTASISFLISYPDTIKVPFCFKSAPAAYPVRIGADGIIQEAIVSQGALVVRDHPLALIRTQNGQTLTVKSPASGRVGSSLLLQPGIQVIANETLFVIRSVEEDFYGIIKLPTTSDRIHVGQRVLISLKNFPKESYGQLQGRISYIASEPTKDGSLTAKVILDHSQLKHPMPISEWISGEASVVTQDVSVFKRIVSGIFKKL